MADGPLRAAASSGDIVVVFVDFVVVSIVFAVVIAVIVVAAVVVIVVDTVVVVVDVVEEVCFDNVEVVVCVVVMTSIVGYA